ncbi:hypothetical protein HYV84_03515 [Candidatus Woesearchaeota archaeon]|nr:hypothetical protein [Candidatus Woesearchaeota archaeon]
MASFLERAKKVVDENQDLLTVFEELDRTGKFRKRVYKKKVDFTLDEGLVNSLRQYSREHNIPMSRVVENCLRNGLKEAP